MLEFSKKKCSHRCCVANDSSYYVMLVDREIWEVVDNKELSMDDLKIFFFNTLFSLTSDILCNEFDFHNLLVSLVSV